MKVIFVISLNMQIITLSRTKEINILMKLELEKNCCMSTELSFFTDLLMRTFHLASTDLGPAQFK